MKIKIIFYLENFYLRIDFERLVDEWMFYEDKRESSLHSTLTYISLEFLSFMSGKILVFLPLFIEKKEKT